MQSSVQQSRVSQHSPGESGEAILCRISVQQYDLPFDSRSDYPTCCQIVNFFRHLVLTSPMFLIDLGVGQVTPACSAHDESRLTQS